MTVRSAGRRVAWLDARRRAHGKNIGGLFWLWTAREWLAIMSRMPASANANVGTRNQQSNFLTEGVLDAFE